MAGSASEDNGAGRSSEGLSGAQRCPSGDSLAEWRSSEQLENGTPSTSPPYWDTDDDDDDCGPKPSELYGKFTWKIENFSQINKRELRSNAFEVGGYKWYILIYPQGCDVCNHLSLFLCVANHDKLLPGWSHFAQFTIAVVNKDPKKSKYSDTLHRFWKKEHDWGWKKFMELSKVLDGFIVSDTLVIKAQVQVIREKVHRPFRCLDCQYRRELVRVYLSNVELICRRFVEERRGKLGKLIEDKVRWSSFRAFWLGVDQYARRRMSREKSDAILKVVVKHFFIEKEVTSTLVMDSLYSGLKALESQSTAKKERDLKSGEEDDCPSPMVRVEKDSFVLADDVLLLLERASMEPLPPKDDKGPQNRTKDGNSGEDFNKDSIERDERRLTELGRRTIEIFALAQIFSNRIEVAYQEAVALKRQEELIREEEAAALTENEPRSKRGQSEKEKRSKKKQSKQKRNKKGKDTRREEKSYDTRDRIQQDESSLKASEKQHYVEKQETLEDVSDVSDPADDISESFQPDVEDREAGSINWDTDTSEINPPPEASSCEISSLHVHSAEEKRSVVDDSSSTCSTDSVPSAGTHRHYVMKCSRNRISPKKSGKNEQDISSNVQASENHEAVDVLPPSASIGAKGEGADAEAVISLKDRIQRLEQTLVEKEVQVESLQRKLGGKEKVETLERPVNAVKLNSVQSSDTPCASNGPTASAPIKLLPKQASEPVQSRKNHMNGMSSQTDKPTPVLKVTQNLSVSKSDGQKPGISVKPIQNATTDKAMTPQVSVMMRPSSVPISAASRPSTSSSSMGQYTSSLARSASASGRLGMDTVSQVSQGIVQQSYRNAIVGKSSSSSSTTFIPRQTPSSTTPTSYSQTPSSTFPCSTVMLTSPMPMKQDDASNRSSFTFGAMNPGVLTQPQWMEGTQRDVAGVPDVQLLSDISSLSLYDASDGRGNSHYTEQMQLRHSQVHEEFPHLDIINDLLDEEQTVGKSTRTGLHNAINGHRHGFQPFNRQLTFPGDIGMADMGPSINSGKYNRTARYHEDQTNIIYSSSSGPYDAHVAPNVSMSGFPTGQMDGIAHSQWHVNGGADLSMLNVRSMEGDGYPFQVPDYSNLTCGVNGYSLYRPRSQR